jgi:hypothetical protein
MLISGCAGSISRRFSSTHTFSFFFDPLQLHRELADLLIQARCQRLVCFLLPALSHREHLGNARPAAVSSTVQFGWDAPPIPLLVHWPSSVPASLPGRRWLWYPRSTAFAVFSFHPLFFSWFHTAIFSYFPVQFLGDIIKFPPVISLDKT